MNWFQQNWDKVVTFVLSAIVGGVIGFFSAISVVNNEMKDLNTQVAVLKDRLEQAVGPKLKDLDLVNTRVVTLEIKFAAIEAQSVMIKAQSDILLKAQVEHAPSRIK
jgi:hypothetical protein